MVSNITDGDKQLMKEHRSLLKFQISDTKSTPKYPAVFKEKESEPGDISSYPSKSRLLELGQQTPSPSPSSSTVSSSLESASSEDYGGERDEEEGDEKSEETTTTSEEEEEEDYSIIGTEYGPLVDFFDNIDSLIPELDEISLSPSTLTAVSTVSVKESVEATADVGKFVSLVDPGAGIDDFFEDADAEEKEGEEEETNEEEQEEEDKQGVEDIESVEFSFDFDAVDEQFDGKLDEDLGEGEGGNLADEEEATFATFLELQAHLPVSISEIDDAEEKKKEEKRETQHLTAQFLQDLIEMCVKMAEQMDITAYMRKNLDKRKIIIELKAMVPYLISEQWARQFLNRKCVEHFRRIKGFRRLTENPKTVIQDMDRFYETIIQLDELLGKESEVITSTRTKEIELTRQLEEIDEKAKQEIETLEHLMKQTLNPHNSSRIENVVKNSMQKMADTRNDISKIRFRMILEQHKYASLVERLRKLEDFGNNLSMRGFETMHTETLSLAKKLEERTAELNRLRFRCHTDIHTMAHLKEKEKMVRDTIAKQKEVLDAKYVQKEMLRERIVELKIQRNKVRKETRELSFKCGLLDKPALLEDYHHTEEYLENLRKSVKKLRSTTKKLTKKIEFVEKLCKPGEADRKDLK
uniref:CCDC113/CCDC96 coiled-coil domain-containing protein n=1 Tax=Glossina palpalis gambiensis TaxID=67801 RepID=A0A1B0C4Y3_9MUSC